MGRNRFNDHVLSASGIVNLLDIVHVTKAAQKANNWEEEEKKNHV